MERIALRIDPDVPFQAQTITIDPDGHTVSLRLELRYLVYTEKWYLSIWNASTGTNLLQHLPIVPSETIINDLLGQFHYLGIGSVACFPVSAQQYGEMPGRADLDKYEVQWGDTLAK